jgi:EAL domain-containing protein (putative c-di-GMP-specific phosphodiesterase class I)
VTDERLRSAIERAITGNELVLQYQPRVLVSSLELRGVEALVRWKDPVRGIVPATELIAAAELAGLMGNVDSWVVRQALLQAAVWRRDGMRVGVSVNIGPVLLGDESFLRLFERTLKIQGDPTTLTIEVAAPSLAAAERPLAGLTRLRGHGVRLALDDVTSVAQLDAASWIKWDYVKIGRAVVSGASKDAGGERRLRLVADATSALGVRVVGMGVEDDATLALLRELGVFLAQGYLFAPPLGVKELTEWSAGHATRPA